MDKKYDHYVYGKCSCYMRALKKAIGQVEGKIRMEGFFNLLKK